MISVVIPVYNVEKYLRECLNSVVNQTFKNIEIICVNDGSLDNSSTILEEFVQKDSRIKVIHKQNGGLSAARNDGMDILNLSLGGPAYNGTVANAIKSMYDSGIAVFCSSGNDDTNALNYPASYKGAISIAAIDKGAQKSSFSSYGSKVRYAAPGVDIISTAKSGSYVSMDGTSMACPAAAGTASEAYSSMYASQAEKTEETSEEM